jgi:hypothetical protein
MAAPESVQPFADGKEKLQKFLLYRSNLGHTACKAG